MTVKLAGGLLILAAGFFAAQLGAYREKKRLTVLDAWLELLLEIRTQIDCYLTPLDEILQNARPALLQACTGGEDVKPSLAELLNAAESCLDPECQRLLQAFTREIGASYRDEQLKRCDFYLQALQVERERIARALPARVKLTVTLSLCAAIGIAIILW